MMEDHLRGLIRFPWNAFPPVVRLVDVPVMKGHSEYPQAKAGDMAAAKRMVGGLLTPQLLAGIQTLAGISSPWLLAVHAIESAGVNRIPAALAEAVGECLGWPLWTGVVQANRVSHTGARGFARLANQAVFDGPIISGACILVDDFVGMGGTLANLRGYVLAGGATVTGALTLTARPHSTILTLSGETQDALERKHGKALEPWWCGTFGFGFACLTESEARYLLGHDADTIRDHLAEAGFH